MVWMNPFRFYVPVYYAHSDSSTKLNRFTLRRNASGTLLLDSPRMLALRSLFLSSVTTRAKSFTDPVCALRRMGSKICALILPPTKSKSLTFPTHTTFPTHMSSRNSPQLNLGSHRMGSLIMGSLLLSNKEHPSKQNIPALIATNISDPDREPPDPEPPPILLSSSYDTRLLAGDLLPTHDPETLIGQTFYYHHNPMVNKTMPKSNNMKMMSSRILNTSSSVSKSMTLTPMRILSHIPRFSITLRTPKITPTTRRWYGSSTAFQDIKAH
jgi:hypothetical protein